MVGAGRWWWVCALLASAVLADKWTPPPSAIQGMLEEAMVDGHAEFVYSAGIQPSKLPGPCEFKGLKSPCKGRSGDKGLIVFLEDATTQLMSPGVLTFPRCTLMCVNFDGNTERLLGLTFVKQQVRMRPPANATGGDADAVFPLSGWFRPQLYFAKDAWAMPTLCGREPVSGWALSGAYPPTYLTKAYAKLPQPHTPPTVYGVLTSLGVLASEVASTQELQAATVCMTSKRTARVDQFVLTAGEGRWAKRAFAKRNFEVRFEGTFAANEEKWAVQSQMRLRPTAYYDLVLTDGFPVLEHSPSDNNNNHSSSNSGGNNGDGDGDGDGGTRLDLVRPATTTERLLGISDVELPLSVLNELVADALAAMNIPSTSILRATLEDLPNLRLANDAGKSALTARAVLTRQSLVMVIETPPVGSKALRWRGMRLGSLLPRGSVDDALSTWPSVTLQLQYPYTRGTSRPKLDVIFDVRGGADNIRPFRLVGVADVAIQGTNAGGDETKLVGAAEFRFEENAVGDKEWLVDTLPEHATKRGALEIKFSDDHATLQAKSPLKLLQLRWHTAQCAAGWTPSTTDELNFFPSALSITVGAKTHVALDGHGEFSMMRPKASERGSSRTLFAAEGTLVFEALSNTTDVPLFKQPMYAWSKGIMNRYLWHYYALEGCFTVDSVVAAIDAMGGWDVQLPALQRALRAEAESLRKMSTSERNARRQESDEPQTCLQLERYIPWRGVHKLLARYLGWNVERTKVGLLGGVFDTFVADSPVTIEADSECRQASQLAEHCIPKVAQCIHPTEPYREHIASLRETCEIAGMTTTSTRFKRAWGLCWDARWARPDCAAGQPLAHANKLLSEAKQGLSMLIARSTRVDVHASRHYGRNNTAHFNPSSVTVEFQALLGRDGNSRAYAQAMPPYMLTSGAQRQAAMRAFEEEQAAVGFLQGVFGGRQGCGAPLAKLGVEAGYGAASWRSMVNIADAPPARPQRVALAVESKGSGVFLLHARREFVGEVVVHLHDITDQFAPTRISLSVCVHRRCSPNQRTRLRPGKHYIVPEGCRLDVPSAQGEGEDDSDGDGDGDNVASNRDGGDSASGVVCERSSQVTVRMERPLVMRGVVVGVGAVHESRARVALDRVVVFGPDALGSPTHAQFQMSRAWRPTDEKDLEALAAKPDLLERIFRAATARPQMLERLGELEGKPEAELRAEVARLEGEYAEAARLHGALDSSLLAIALDDYSASVVVEVDSAPIRKRLTDLAGPDMPVSRRPDAGFLRFAYALSDAHFSTTPDPAVVASAQAAVGDASVDSAPGVLFAAFCAGLCGPTRVPDLPVTGLELVSASAVPLPHAVRAGDAGLGRMFMHLDKVTAELGAPRISMDVALLFPPRTAPTFLGAGVKLDDVDDTLGSSPSHLLQKHRLQPAAGQDALPSVVLRLLRMATLLHNHDVARLLKAKALGVSTDFASLHRFPSALSQVGKYTELEFFGVRVVWSTEGAGDSFKMHPLADESALLSLPVTGDRLWIAPGTTPWEDSNVGSRVQARLVPTAADPTSSGATAREFEFTFGGGKVVARFGAMDLKGFSGEDTQTPLMLEFLAEVRPTADALEFTPPTSGITELLNGLGFAAATRWLDTHLFFTNHGMVDRVKSVYREIVSVLPQSTVKQRCQLVLRGLFAQNVDSDALQSGCDEVEEFAKQQAEENPMKVMVKYVRTLLRSRVYSESLEPFFPRKGLVPEEMRFVVRVLGDGTVQFGLDLPQPMTGLMRTRQQKPNEPKLLGVKLGRMIAGCVLGGTPGDVQGGGKAKQEGEQGEPKGEREGGEEGKGEREAEEGQALAAARPINELSLEMRLLPVVLPPERRSAVMLRRDMRDAATKQDMASRFDNAFLFENLRVSVDPAEPTSACLLCHDAMGLESFSPHSARLTYVVKSDCTSPDVGKKDAETGQLKRPGLTLSPDSVLELPFVVGQRRLPPTIPSAQDLLEELQEFLSCDGTPKATTLVVAGMTRTLAKLGPMQRTQMMFDGISVRGTLQFSILGELAQNIHKDADVTSGLGTGGIGYLVTLAQETPIVDLSECPLARVKSAWESARADETDPNSLSPNAARRRRQRPALRDPQQLRAKAEEAMAPNLTGLEDSEKAKVVDALLRIAPGSVVELMEDEKAGRGDAGVGPDLTQALALVAIDNTLFEGTPLEVRVQANMAFLLEGLLANFLRGGFKVEATFPGPPAIEVQLDGAMRYDIASVVGLDVQGRGRVRIGDRAGPISVSARGESIHLEVHLGTEDTRIFVVVQLGQLGQVGVNDAMLDIRVGSAELVRNTMAGKTAISSGWWGRGKKVTVKEVAWLLKIFTHGTKVLPDVLPEGQLSMVRVVGLWSELLQGKGRLMFHNGPRACFELDIGRWAATGSWTGFDVNCALAVPKRNWELTMGSDGTDEYRKCEDEDEGKKDKKDDEGGPAKKLLSLLPF